MSKQERTTPYEVPVPALLHDGMKAVFWIDLIRLGRGKREVHVVTEFRQADGTIKRVDAWLSEDDSIEWAE